MRVVDKVKRRIPWPAVVAVFMLGCLGMSIAGYTETYNFYFDKKKTDEKEGEETQAIVAPVAPTAAPTPIVINNNNTNNVGTPSSVTSNNNTGVATGPTVLPAAVPASPAPVQAPAPVVALPALVAPSPVVVTAPASTSGVFARPADISPWRMSLTGMAFLQEAPKAYVSSGEIQFYKKLEPTWGGLLSVGYNFSRSVSMNLYGGLRVADYAHKRTYAHLGADLEFMPFRIPISERHDLLQFGFLFGGSTAMAAGPKYIGSTSQSVTGQSRSAYYGSNTDNWGSLHAGVRLNINIAPEFGITTSARANLGYVLLEGGIVARL